MVVFMPALSHFLEFHLTEAFHNLAFCLLGEAALGGFAWNYGVILIGLGMCQAQGRDWTPCSNGSPRRFTPGSGFVGVLPFPS
jgi:hypothetical protein